MTEPPSRSGLPTAGSPAVRMATDPAPTEVVTCFLRHRGDVLLVRRSRRVGTYRGRWGGVAGHVEGGDPLEDAWREIGEETGLGDAVSLVKRGEPFTFEDPEEGRRWRVHPFLFDAGTRDAILDWEAVEGAWVPPTAILERACVPRLWTSYARVAPTPGDVARDREHGSAYLSFRALEVLRDRAAALVAGKNAPGVEAPGIGEPGVEAPVAEPGGSADPRVALIALARSLCEARPAMNAVRNRVNRAMTAAFAGGDASGAGATGEPSGAFARRVAAAAQDALQGALRAEDGAIAAAARQASGRRVLTLSLSGTVADALLAAAPGPERVIVCESRPGGEGRALVDRLGSAGIDTVLVPDAAVAWAVERFGVDVVLVGADTVLPEGAVVNKVGTRPAALAARAAGVPFLAAAARDKIAPEGRAWSVDEEGSAEDPEARTPSADEAVRHAEPADRRAPLEVWRAPLFECTPVELVDGIVSEAGLLGGAEVREAASEHAAREAWDR